MLIGVPGAYDINNDLDYADVKSFIQNELESLEKESQIEGSPQEKDWIILMKGNIETNVNKWCFFCEEQELMFHSRNEKKNILNWFSIALWYKISSILFLIFLFALSSLEVD